MILRIFRIVSVAFSIVPALAPVAPAQEGKTAYLDVAQPLEKRADDLVGRMTLEEKASQLVNSTRAMPRLGVPEYNLWSEALHGVARNGIAAVFPQAIGLAATFDAPLLHEMAKAIAVEARIKFNQATKAKNAGRLTPPISGNCILGVEGAGNRPFLDDKLLIDTSRNSQSAPNTVELSLEKGRSDALKIESTPGFFASARFVCKPTIQDARQRAVEAARQADIVAAVVGITSDLEGEEMRVDTPDFKGGDRTNLDLPKEKQELIETVKATGKPLIVVLMSGSALGVNWANEHANAILQAWYPGEEGGSAIAETIAGENNPAGCLPVIFYKGVEQLPAFEDYSMAHRTYRYFEGEPLYPFGYELSFSNFAYSNVKLSKTKLSAEEPLQVEAQVANTSKWDGDEVVQAYISFPKVPGAPRQALRGFTRIHMKAGEIRRVQFTLNDRDLNYVNEAGTRLVGAGKYGIAVGGGQPGTAAAATTASFEIRGKQNLPR